MRANGIHKAGGGAEGAPAPVALSSGVQPPAPEPAIAERSLEPQTSLSGSVPQAKSWWSSWWGPTGRDLSTTAQERSSGRDASDEPQERVGAQEQKPASNGAAKDGTNTGRTADGEERPPAARLAVDCAESALEATDTTSPIPQPAEDPSDPPLPNIDGCSGPEANSIATPPPGPDQQTPPILLAPLQTLRSLNPQSWLSHSLSSSPRFPSSASDVGDPTNKNAPKKVGRNYRSSASFSCPPERKRLRHTASEASAFRWWIFGASVAAKPTASTATATVSFIVSEPISAGPSPVRHASTTPDFAGAREPLGEVQQALGWSPRGRSVSSQLKLRAKFEEDDLRRASLRSVTSQASQEANKPEGPSGPASRELSRQGSRESLAGRSTHSGDREIFHPVSAVAPDSSAPQKLERQQRSQSSPPTSSVSSWWPFGFGSSAQPPSPESGTVEGNRGEGDGADVAGEESRDADGKDGVIAAQANRQSTPVPAADGANDPEAETPTRPDPEPSTATEPPGTATGSRNSPTPSPSSLLTLKGASYFVLGAVAFSRRGSSVSGAAGASHERESDVEGAAGAYLTKSAHVAAKEAVQPRIDNSAALVTVDPQRNSPALDSSADRRSMNDGSSKPEPPLGAPQSPSSVKSTAVPLQRTPNYVLPPLPNPQPLGIPTKPPTTPPPSASQPARSGVTGYLASTGHTVVSKAIGALGGFVWGERRHDAMETEKPREPEAKVPEFPREITKIAIIGIHGWFPIKLFQKVIGEPTGTSPRFCSGMKEAVLNHIRTCHPLNNPDPEITLIPLEGEGKVLDRVARLHAALHARPEWVEALRTADCVLVATHSQGAPVSSILLARLLRERVRPFDRASESPGAGGVTKDCTVPKRDNLDRNNSGSDSSISDPGRKYLLDAARQRIGFLAMAGIAHGPFPSLKSNLIVRYIEAEPARELFEFLECPGDTSEEEERALSPTKRERRRNAELSRTFWNALKEVLDKGVKVTCVASMADQVVPLYSATMHALSHPNLYRAVYIDAPPAQEATAMAQTGHKRLASVDKGRPLSATSASASAEQGKLETPTASSGNTARPLSPRTNLSHVPADPAERPSSRDLDFLNNLIVFALRLRNAGLSDHGLIVHLSEAVAGNLSGTGHSTIYEENEVYALAFKWLLTTDPARPGSRRSSLSGDPEASSPESSRQREWRRSARFLDLPQRFTEPPPGQQQPRLSLPAALPRASLEATTQTPLLMPPICESQLEYFSAPNHLNPYYLPWIIRALLGDPLVAAHADLAAELQGIIQQFRDWEPKGKLVELKYRLEPLKSHL